jgi:hypothetical protein
MKRLLIALSLCLLVGCDDASLDVCGPIFQVARTLQRPVVNPPVEQRQSNWLSGRQGSCVWATACTILRSQGRPDLAYRVGQHGGAVTAVGFAAAMQSEGIALRQTESGNASFIDRCMSEGRACGAIVDADNRDRYFGDHVVAIVYADAAEIGFIDPNNVELIEYVPRRDFVYEWQRSSGWAFTFEY